MSKLQRYVCYTPIILWVTQMPVLGMLMIPKTMAYLAVAFLAYRELFRRPASVQAATA